MINIGDTFKVKGVNSFVEVVDFDDEIIDFKLKNGVKRVYLEMDNFKEMELSGEIKLISKG